MATNIEQKCDLLKAEMMGHVQKLLEEYIKLVANLKTELLEKDLKIGRWKAAIIAISALIRDLELEEDISVGVTDTQRENFSSPPANRRSTIKEVYRELRRISDITRSAEVDATIAPEETQRRIINSVVTPPPRRIAELTSALDDPDEDSPTIEVVEDSTTIATNWLLATNIEQKCELLKAEIMGHVEKLLEEDKKLFVNLKTELLEKDLKIKAAISALKMYFEPEEDISVGVTDTQRENFSSPPANRRSTIKEVYRELRRISDITRSAEVDATIAPEETQRRIINSVVTPPPRRIAELTSALDDTDEDSPTIEVVEDSPTIEVVEDSPTIEVVEDSPTIEVVEDSPTIAVVEDWSNISVRDDFSTIAVVEDSHTCVSSKT